MCVGVCGKGGRGGGSVHETWSVYLRGTSNSNLTILGAGSGGELCITFVFHFFWVLQPSPEKLKAMLMQNFGNK